MFSDMVGILSMHWIPVSEVRGFLIQHVYLSTGRKEALCNFSAVKLIYWINCICLQNDMTWSDFKPQNHKSLMTIAGRLGERIGTW